MAIRVTRFVVLGTLFLFFFTVMRLHDSPLVRTTCHSPNGTFGDLATFASLASEKEGGRLENHHSPAADVAPSKADSDSGNAYVFYASKDEYACSVLVNIHRLQHVLHAKYPIYVLASPGVSQEYLDAFKAVNVTVSVHTPPSIHPRSPAIAYYGDCLLKLLSFKMHQMYPSLKRILALDSDQLILQNLDHIFDLPKVELAAPRAYWLKKDTVSSTFMLIQLSDSLWNIVDNAINHIKIDQYDMDIVNELFGDTALVLTGHYIMINSHWETWQLPNWFRVEGKSSSKEIAKSEAPKPGVPKPGAPKPDAPKPEVPKPKVDKRQEIPDGADGHDTSSPEKQVPFETLPGSPHNEPASSLSVSATAVVNSVVPTLTPIPALHPNHTALYSLYRAGYVLHFFALGKPWTYTLNDVQVRRAEAHPVFLEQFKTWRETAMAVCPAVDGLDDAGRKIKVSIIDGL